MTARAARLIARALSRAWRRQPLRAFAATVGVVLGAGLATLVVSIDDAVSHAAGAANGTAAVHADLAVRARSAGGVDAALGRRLRAAVPGARITAVLQVNSRVAGSGDAGSVLSLLGVDERAGRFFTRSNARSLVRRRAPRDAPGLLIGRSWLLHNGYRVGDRIELLTGSGVSSWTVVGAVPGSLPNEGALAAGAIEAVGRAFDRAHRVDTFYVQDPPGASRGAVAARLRAAAGPAMVVGPPDVVGETSARSLAIVQAMLYVAGLVGLLSAATVVFVCWRLLLENERASIARFRLTGATPRQLAGGAGIVLLAATIVCCLVGVPTGIFGARLLRSLTAKLIGFSGLAAVPASDDVGAPAVAGVAGALVIGCAAWLASVRAFLRIPALEAVRPPDPPPPARPRHRAALAAAGLALPLATCAILWLPFRLAAVAVLASLAGACALTVAAPPLLGRAIAGEHYSYAQLAAGRHLAADARRSSAIILMVGLSITAGLTLAGVARSYQTAIDRSVRSWTHADLFVRLGRPGATLRDARFPAEVQRRLARVPGVTQAGAFTYVLVDYENRNVMVQAYDTGHIRGIADLIVYGGARGSALWRALGRGSVAVSQSMARLDSLRVGDAISLPTVDGRQRLRIAAIVDDYVSEGGTIVASMRTFARLTGERRIDDIPLTLTPGLPPSQAAARVRAALPQYESLTLLDRTAFRATVTAFIGNVVALFRGVALAAFFIVLLASTLSLAASLAVRRRTLGIAQVCGASPRTLRLQLCTETIAMAVAAWLVAGVVTLVLIPAILRAMAAQTGLLPHVVVPLPDLLLALPVAIGIGLLAALAVTRMTLSRTITEAVGFE